MSCKKYFLILLFTLPLFLFEHASGQREDRGYELLPAPDLWYNDVDGIRVGIRLRGQVPGTFHDGPHRLDLGVWLGTWIPTYPVSYFIRYTEPIPGISDFNSEGSISAISSIRTGFHHHSLLFEKRWQQGFNEDIYRELDIQAGTHRRFSNEYVPFPEQWQNDWVYFLGSGYELQRHIAGQRGFTRIRISGTGGFVNDEMFTTGTIEVSNTISLNRSFRIGLRGTGTISSDHIPLEYGLFRSTASPIDWMDSGFTRAKGTIPTPWMNSGAVNISGGPSLRGYNGEDIRMMKKGLPLLFQNFYAVNVELDYPNPLDRIFATIPLLGEFLRLRSYLFYDGGAGYTLEQSVSLDPELPSGAPFPEITQPDNSVSLMESEGSPYFSNLGAGFMLSLNIPDYLGKPRGFVIRYEIPFWLSHPENGQDNFRYRGHLGIGAVIGF
jgi:hypothetical protein